MEGKFMSAVDQAFQALLYGEGAWFGLLLISSIILVTALRYRMLCVIYLPITVFMGISYLNNVEANSDLTWLALIMFIIASFLLVIFAS
jgi:hypothetical protein